VSPKLQALIPNRAELIDAIAVLILTGIAVSAFQSSYGGVAFLIIGVFAAVVGVAIAYAWTKLEWAWPFAVLAALIAYVTVIGAVALSDRSIGGFIPTPESATASLRSIIHGWKELVTTRPPVGRTGDLMAIPAFSGVACATAGYLLARRTHLAPLALIGPFAVLGLAIATGLEEPVSIVLHGAIMMVVTIGWLSYREEQRRPLLDNEASGRSNRRLFGAVLVLLVAGAGGVVLADSVPGAASSERDIWRRTIVPPFDPQQYPSPLNGYRQYVKAADCRSEDPVECADIPEEDRDPVMFTVEGLPVEVPVRLATMDAYDGLVWQVSAGDAEEPSLENSGAFERVGASISPEYDGELANVVITIGEYSDVWIPTVGEVISLRFVGSEGGPDRDRRLAEAFRYNRATDTGASPVRLREGDRYEMQVRLPVALEEYAGEEIVGSVRGLGTNVPVTEITNKLSSAELLAIGDDGERLDFVSKLMRTFGTYSDGDIAASQIRSQAGHSAFRLTDFVQLYPKRPLIGNAEQYSAAFALMFRDVGDLPTRVVMGFMPSGDSTAGTVNVTATEVEAWVELPFVEHGWVPIWPTPPRDQTAIQTNSPQQPEPDYRTQNPPPPPLIDPEFDQAATRSGQAKATDDEPVAPPVVDSPDDGGLPFADAFSAPIVLISLGVAAPFIVATLVGLVVVLLKRRRRRRRRGVGLNHERIANGWREITDFAVDAGHAVPPTTTRREAATFVGAGTAPLAARADAAVWGAGEPADAEVAAYWAELSGALEQMKSELSFVDRIKTSVSLQSLQRSERRRAAKETT